MLVEAVELDLVFANEFSFHPIEVGVGEWGWMLVLVVRALDLDLVGHISPSSQRLVQVEQ